MQTPQQLIDQMLAAARNEGRQEIRDAVMAALGVERPRASKPKTRSAYGATRQALLGALTKRDGQTVHELTASSGLAGARLYQGIQSALAAKAITAKGARGSRRYYLASKARAK